MARKRFVRAAGINVALVEHSQREYARLIETMFRARRPVAVRGNEYMMLTSIDKPTSDRDKKYRGTFARFTEINFTLPWLDVANLRPASDTDLADIQIPDNLRPNYSSFFFQFDISKHIFLFETKSSADSVSPRQVEKFVRGLVRSVEGDLPISINLIADASSVEEILDMDVLRNLTITLELPNPDINEELERKLRRRMRKQNAQRQVQVLDAIPGETLRPDEGTVELAVVAAANGEVEGRGTSDGVPAKISTKDFPLSAAVRYDPDLTSDQQAFEAAALKLIAEREGN